MGSTNITIEDIRKIFQDMFNQHQEAIKKKQEKMFRSHENSIMQLISGNTTLTNQRLEVLSKEIADLKASLEFTQEKTEGKFNKVKWENNHNGMKSVQPQEIHWNHSNH